MVTSYSFAYVLLIKRTCVHVIKFENTSYAVKSVRFEKKKNESLMYD